LKDFDRQIGGLFGAAKGVLLCVAITFFAVSLSEPARAMVLKSRSGYYIALLIDRADPIMPKEIHDVLGPYLRKLEERLDPRSSPQPANRTTPYPGNA
jgi:membrane protein required for colicin V production